METGLRDRVTLVTGALGGIGSEVARWLGREGARVALHYRTGPASAERLRQSLPGSAAFHAELTDEGDVASLFRDVEGSLGPVEILVANAGIWEERDTPIWEMSLAQWRQTLDTNLTSVFLCVRELCRGVKRHRLTDPAAVLVGSTAGIFGEAGHCDYAASKAGMTYGLLMSLKNEMARLSPRARINAVCPSWVLTPMAESFASDEKAVKRALQTVPLRKLARPADVAAAVVFLASSRLSGHLTGQSLVVAGGMEGRVLYEPSELRSNHAKSKE